MKIKNILILSLILIGGSCITQFIPQTDEDKNLLVVEGLITDHPDDNVVKLSLSMPLGKKSILKPLKGCIVTVTDDKGSQYYFYETSTAGTYKSTMQGKIGRKYTLHVSTKNTQTNYYSYQSLPMEMLPVPPIDSIYYEKVTIAEKTAERPELNGCQIYLNAHDPTGNCKYYRWDYNETWQFRLPFGYPKNNTCWISNNSTIINIKNTKVVSEDRINRFPLRYISNETDRLSVKYSILVNQYSLNVDEFDYWEKMQNVTQDVGGLYDIIPSTVTGNIFCVEEPSAKVLGYFSVSAKTSKRIFIKDYFSGLVNLYTSCALESDTIPGSNPDIEGLNINTWILEQNWYYTVITKSRYCADCTTRGTTTKPDFWDDGN
ncbi:MAG: DUF4249 domain-containing protein [Bacteroidota bacterium]|nr:DUF4249 domain-containing protein [Bacteroidota bacterium]